jgi:hypothetical protein
MQFERTIRLRVIDWPRFNRTTTFDLDAAIFPAERSLRQHVQERFGEGVMHKVGEAEWEYRRTIRGPRFFWSMLAGLLNKSYA